MFNKLYTISFNTFGGNKIESISCKAKKDIPELPLPVKDGYKFVSWFLDKDLKEEFSFEKMPKKDLELFAKWEVISLEEFASDINFFTKSSNILKNLQNDYEGVPDFKDSVKKDDTKKKTKKKASAKKSTKKKACVKKKETEKVEEIVEEVSA